MRFDATSKVAFPAGVVVRTLIKRMDDLVAYMPNISGIETQLIEEQPDGRVKTIRAWQGTAKSSPAVIRPFLSKDSLGWIDYSIWDLTTGTCDWYIENKHSRFSSCSGVNSFLVDPEAPETSALLKVEGDFTVFGDKIPAVPAFLGKRMAPTIEKIIVSFMKPNFTAMAAGANALLTELRDRGEL
ncbi:MAG: hypothetical protein EP329_08715 [Deltaproteobacteria bacterium]|nr:MAG: hypothetical protein EP329_08715 [Deltaproteobacteria bacterium]